MWKKGDLSGMAIDARRAGLTISETTGVLGFSLTKISMVYREWSEKEYTHTHAHAHARTHTHTHAHIRTHTQKNYRVSRSSLVKMFC